MVQYDLNVIEKLLRQIVKAIQVGACDRIREYLEESHNYVNNAIRDLRGDAICTVLHDCVETPLIVGKKFSRNSWIGYVLIDKEHKLTFSICSKKNLEYISKKNNLNKPHHLQTLLCIQNDKVEARDYQLSLFEEEKDEISFSEETYWSDYASIMENYAEETKDYLHLVIAYDVTGFTITYLKLMQMTKDFQIAREEDLRYLLSPDFGELTVSEVSESVTKDAHLLVRPKIGKINSEREEPRIIVKKKLEEKQS